MASIALATSITPDPALALLNLKSPELTRTQFQLLIHINTAAKQTIAKAWKTQTLVVADAKHRINRALFFAKMTAIEDNKIKQYNMIWQPWVKHFLSPDFDQTLLLPC